MALVADAALPVVFWFNVATLAAAIVPELIFDPLIDVTFAPLPFNVPLNWVAVTWLLFALSVTPAVPYTREPEPQSS